MKFIRSQKARAADRPFVFLITPQEKKVLLQTLQMYPVVNKMEHRLSRNPDAAGKAAQEWLEEAMRQQRKDYDKRLGQFLANSRLYFKEAKDELHLTLTGEQMEWLLRILNAIRVGSWERLGRPEMETVRTLAQGGRRHTFISLMELTGYFESALLEAYA